jgi:hypothetical protein
MYLLSLPPEVQLLAKIGDDTTPGQKWPDYGAMGIRNEHIPALISILENLDELPVAEEADNADFLPMHAWRALAYLKAEEAIPLMVRLLDHADTDFDDLIDEALPEALGKMGAAAYPVLSEMLFNQSNAMWARLNAAEALMLFAIDHPDDRLRVINTLSEALENFQSEDFTFNSILIDDLIKLKGVEAAPLVEKVYESDKLDPYFSGDWEDFQVQVGLIKERTTSPTRNQISPGSFSDGFSGLPGSLGSAGKSKEDIKTKKKRKEANKSKKANRHKKKK